jgi:arylsulfatase A-like enzyme
LCKTDCSISLTFPQSAIRKGKYKLIYFYEENKFELYNLGKDPLESNDLSNIQPWDALALKKELFDYLNNVQARFPRVNINKQQIDHE